MATGTKSRLSQEAIYLCSAFTGYDFPVVPPPSIAERADETLKRYESCLVGTSFCPYSPGKKHRAAQRTKGQGAFSLGKQRKGTKADSQVYGTILKVSKEVEKHDNPTPPIIFLHYSARSASMGSRLAARWAGIIPANRPMTTANNSAITT